MEEKTEKREKKKKYNGDKARFSNSCAHFNARIAYKMIQNVNSAGVMQ